MPDFLTLDDVNVAGKIVLLRADLNVPMQNGRVTDATRMERLLPTLREILATKARIVLLSHFGRPKGRPEAELSLRPVAEALGKLLGQSVAFAPDCVGPVATAAVAALQPGQVLVLENTRFHPGEEANDSAFAHQLAALGEVYVNDAFSMAHRVSASTTLVPQLLPAAAGRLMQEELEALTKALEKPERPVVALVGGSKISTKLDLLRNLIAKVDVLVLGGGMANTFMAARGISIGKSLFEPHMLGTALTIMAEADKRGCFILLPEDVVVAEELAPGVATQIVSAQEVPEDHMIFDLGPKTIQAIKVKLAQGKTAVWNGPLGVFEVPPFDKATNEVARGLAALTKQGKILSVAGGGDTVAALANAGVTDDIGYLSTAGGAFLEWLEGKDLPGVMALRQAVPEGKRGRVVL